MNIVQSEFIDLVNNAVAIALVAVLIISCFNDDRGGYS